MFVFVIVIVVSLLDLCCIHYSLVCFLFVLMISMLLGIGLIGLIDILYASVCVRMDDMNLLGIIISA
jgi:hypothetical protein